MGPSSSFRILHIFVCTSLLFVSTVDLQLIENWKNSMISWTIPYKPNDGLKAIKGLKAHLDDIKDSWGNHLGLKLKVLVGSIAFDEITQFLIAIVICGLAMTVGGVTALVLKLLWISQTQVQTYFGSADNPYVTR